MMTNPSWQKPLSSQRSYWVVKVPWGSEQIGILQDPDQLDFNQEEVDEQESREQPMSCRRTICQYFSLVILQIR